MHIAIKIYINIILAALIPSKILNVLYRFKYVSMYTVNECTLAYKGGVGRSMSTKLPWKQRWVIKNKCGFPPPAGR